MQIENLILKFLKDNGYLDNEHVLGVLFCGSYLTGLNHKDSDIDLQIVFDDNKLEQVRGNSYVECIDEEGNNRRIRVEFFEKSLSEVYQCIDNDYESQNNASLTIYGTSKIIWSRDDQLMHLQEYVCDKFSNPLPVLSNNTAMEYVSIISNRMEKLESYADTDDPYFEHLYQLTIEKIRRFYHSLIGASRMETSKCFNLYVSEKYREAFCISKMPEPEFIELYFKAIYSDETNKKKKFQLLKSFWDFARRNVELDNNNHRIAIESRNKDIDIPIDISIVIPSTIIDDDSIEIPSIVKEKVSTFIQEMGYLDDKHCIGAFIYGSSLTGFNSDISDIDMTVIYDDSDPKHFIRGAKLVSGTKIEYFEKPIHDIYLSAEVGFHNQDNVFYSLIGKGTIVFAKDDRVRLLQRYVINRFSEALPPLSEDEAKNYVSILNNRMEKLKKYASLDSPLFEHLYHIVIEKIRKFYHKLIGISRIPTSKVYRIYTDDAYRVSTYKENPEQKFVDMYINLITSPIVSRKQKFEMVKEFFEYATRDVSLGDEYRVKQSSGFGASVRQSPKKGNVKCYQKPGAVNQENN